MTDREMLELAAKAAGYVGFVGNDLGREYFCVPSKPDVPRSEPQIFYWLYDDGDALRLETHLKLTSSWDSDHNGWKIGGIVGCEFAWLSFHEDRKRATTMAAAEIGRMMP